MGKLGESDLMRGFLFACTMKTQEECFARLLFGADKPYAPIVIRVRKGDLLFLNNIEADVLYGVFRAISNGKLNIQPEAWKGKYPYQVMVEKIGAIKVLKNAKKRLGKLKIKRNTPILGRKLIGLISKLTVISALHNPELKAIETKILKNIKKIDVEKEIPPIEATTLWDFPRQNYGLRPKGNNKYPGVTPALIIYNLIWRYTDPWDLVVDPMCGSGTTIDVCLEERRKCVGLDISPSSRKDEIQSDARNIPLKDECADMIFIDSPYGDNVKYNEHPGCICNISAEENEFYDELEKIMVESRRILKEDKIIAWLIGDQWVKKKYTPVGFKVYERLNKHFEPVDVIAVTRRGQTSHTGMWYNRARRFNFYLRGFKHLIIMRKKSNKNQLKTRRSNTKWKNYER